MMREIELEMDNMEIRKAVKTVFNTKIINNEKIASDVYSMTLEYPGDLCDQAAPGQFINIYLNRKDLLLPRPISICRIEKKQAEAGKLVIVYRLVGTGTKEMAGYSPDTYIRVSSPLGNGYNLSVFPTAEKEKRRSALLVGGGIGIPPLLELAYNLKAMDIKIDAVLGFRDEPFLQEDFVSAGAQVHLATDNGKTGFHGTVLELIQREELTADICFACGPVPMLKALAGYCSDSGMMVQLSLEERMGCGFGACVGCVCKIKTSEGIVQKKVCKDGPVFYGDEVIWNA